MDASEAMAEIGHIRDEFIEAKRYVRSNPEATRTIVERCQEKLIDLWGKHFLESYEMPRLADNLTMGLGCILANPNVLAGYIVGAVHELSVACSRIEDMVADEEDSR